jgi:hypothetical protein
MIPGVSGNPAVPPHGKSSSEKAAQYKRNGIIAGSGRSCARRIFDVLVEIPKGPRNKDELARTSGNAWGGALPDQARFSYRSAFFGAEVEQMRMADASRPCNSYEVPPMCEALTTRH